LKRGEIARERVDILGRRTFPEMKGIETNAAGRKKVSTPACRRTFPEMKGIETGTSMGSGPPAPPSVAGPSPR